MENTFESLVERFSSGHWTPEHNRLAGMVESPSSEDVSKLPERGTQDYQALTQLWRAAIDQGQVGALILSGGMATRFNYDQPKGLYPILDGSSFLELKIRWIRELSASLPIYVMTSFHTDAAIRAHLEANHHFGADPAGIILFEQYRFRRLCPDGSFFSSPDGHDDHAAPGHGDFIHALRASGGLDKFIAGGGRYMMFSNVDNLGATIDPAIIGWHIQGGHEMSVEVAPKLQGDKGGAPARVDGRMQLVEGFAFPPDFDQDLIPVFNTASYCFNAQALQREIDLPWYLVEKVVDGQTVIQFEHLAGDLSVHLDTGFLQVERDERFIPVKSQADVPTAQELIRRKRVALTCV